MSVDDPDVIAELTLDTLFLVENSAIQEGTPGKHDIAKM